MTRGEFSVGTHGPVTGTQSTSDMAASEDIKRRHWQR